MGGGANRLMDSSRDGKRRDGLNVDLEWEKLGGKRRVLRTGKDLREYKASRGEKVLGIFAPSNTPYVVDRNNSPVVPELREMTAKAIEILGHHHKGYFLLVEGGHIDLAEHSNKMHYAFAEMSSFEHAIKTAREMTDPSETLILVTSDHGHALTIAGYLTANHSIFENDIVEGGKRLPSMFFATGPGYRGGFSKELITDDWRAVNYMQPSAVFTKDGYHGGEDVGIWADGPFAELFSGTMENTNVGYIMKYLLCLGKKHHSICEAKEHHSPLDNLLEFVATMDPKEILSLLMALIVFVIFGAVVIIVLIVLVARRTQSRDIYDLPITSPPSSLDTT